MDRKQYTRRNPPPKGRRRTVVTIPEGVGPHVKLVFAEMYRQNVTYDEVDQRSGVQRATLKAWRHKNVPSLSNLEAVLSVLGYDLIPVPRESALPAHVLAELKPLAERLGLALPQAITALTAIAAGLPQAEASAKQRPNLKLAA